MEANDPRVRSVQRILLAEDDDDMRVDQSAAEEGNRPQARISLDPASVAATARCSDKPSKRTMVAAGWASQRGSSARTIRSSLSKLGINAGSLSVTANAGDALLLDGECPHRSFENRAATDSLHLLFTFVPSRHSHARAAYYEKKLASFADNLVGDGYEFRVFRF